VLQGSPAQAGSRVLNASLTMKINLNFWTGIDKTK
jgi:hypothetical protein